MPEFWHIVLIMLAAWRVTTFIRIEDGPWNVMRRLRVRIGIIHDAEGVPVGWPDTLLGNLFKCFWCLSFWTGLGMYLFWLLSPIIPLVFALSTGAIIVEEIIKYGNRSE